MEITLSALVQMLTGEVKPNGATSSPDLFGNLLSSIQGGGAPPGPEPPPGGFTTKGKEVAFFEPNAQTQKLDLSPKTKQQTALNPSLFGIKFAVAQEAPQTADLGGDVILDLPVSLVDQQPTDPAVAATGPNTVVPTAPNAVAPNVVALTPEAAVSDRSAGDAVASVFDLSGEESSKAADKTTKEPVLSVQAEAFAAVLNAAPITKATVALPAKPKEPKQQVSVISAPTSSVSSVGTRVAQPLSPLEKSSPAEKSVEAAKSERTLPQAPDGTEIEIHVHEIGQSAAAVANVAQEARDVEEFSHLQGSKAEKAKIVPTETGKSQLETVPTPTSSIEPATRKATGVKEAGEPQTTGVPKAVDGDTSAKSKGANSDTRGQREGQSNLAEAPTTLNLEKKSSKSVGGEEAPKPDLSNSGAAELKTSAKTEVRTSGDALQPKPLSTREVKAVIQQISDRIEVLAAKPKGGVTIHLKPQDLGTITLVVKSVGDTLDAQVYASDESVRAAIQNNREGLAQAVQSKGLNLNEIKVSGQPIQSGLSSDSQARHGMPNQQPRQNQAQPAPTYFTGTDRHDPLEARELSRKASGVDLWI